MLESRHLLGLFMLLVVIFGIVFTLGYLLGRSQYDSRLRAAIGGLSDRSPIPTSAQPSAAKAETEAAKPVPDWEFYRSAEPQKVEDRLEPAPKAAAKPAPRPDAEARPKISKTVAASSDAATVKKTSAPTSLNGPLIPQGTIMLQVAALQREGDALALAQALQQKKFPAFVITPGADSFYRVQVGPYKNPRAAAAARQDLESQGFKSIVKR